MFIPLHDANTLKHIRVQYVTIGLILANVAVWAFTAISPETVGELAALGLGYIPAVAYDQAYLDPDLVLVPEDLTYITYAFVHLDVWHLGSNMLFLWVFGDNIEDALGHVKYAFFYLACAALAALAHLLFNLDGNGPLIGASGAVAGVMGAYVLLYPHARVFVLARIVWLIPLPVPAFWMLGFWIASQVFYLVVGAEGGVAWWAHIGGFLAGLALAPLLRRRGVPLLGGR